MIDEPIDTTAETPVARWKSDGDPDGYTLDEVRPKDFGLEVILDLTLGPDDDSMEAFIGLTVTSNGALVSGLAISRKAWIAAVTAQFREGGGPEPIAEGLEKMLNQTHDLTVEESSRRRTADLPDRARRHLHMRDVKIGTGTSTTGMRLWRGSLADVTGWSLGSWNGGE